MNKLIAAFGVWALLFVVTLSRLINSGNTEMLINIVLAWFGGVAFTLLVIQARTYIKDRK